MFKVSMPMLQRSDLAMTYSGFEPGHPYTMQPKHYSRLLCHTNGSVMISSPGNVWPRTNLNHPWILLCHVTEVGRNATVLTYSSYVMSPRLVAMLPSLHTLRMSCHQGWSQCYHPYILFVCHVTEVGRNATILDICTPGFKSRTSR